MKKKAKIIKSLIIFIIAIMIPLINKVMQKIYNCEIYSKEKIESIVDERIKLASGTPNNSTAKNTNRIPTYDEIIKAILIDKSLIKLNRNIAQVPQVILLLDIEQDISIANILEYKQDILDNKLSATILIATSLEDYESIKLHNIFLYIITNYGENYIFDILTLLINNKENNKVSILNDFAHKMQGSIESDEQNIILCNDECINKLLIHNLVKSNYITGDSSVEFIIDENGTKHASYSDYISNHKGRSLTPNDNPSTDI